VLTSTTSGIRAEGSHRPIGDRLIRWGSVEEGPRADGSHQPNDDRLI